MITTDVAATIAITIAANAAANAAATIITITAAAIVTAPVPQ
jgi:hypothetical protein